jgi:hypothetical protein
MEWIDSKSVVGLAGAVVGDVMICGLCDAVFRFSPVAFRRPGPSIVNR